MRAVSALSASIFAPDVQHEHGRNEEQTHHKNRNWPTARQQEKERDGEGGGESFR